MTDRKSGGTPAESPAATPVMTPQEAARRKGVDQIDRTDEQGKRPAAPQESQDQGSRASVDSPGGADETDILGHPPGEEAKEGGIPGTSPLNTSGAAKGHW